MLLVSHRFYALRGCQAKCSVWLAPAPTTINMGRLNLDDACTSTSLKTHAWVELRGLVDLGSAPPRSIPDTLTCSPLRSTNLTTGKEYLVGFKDAMRAAQCMCETCSRCIYLNSITTRRLLCLSLGIVRQLAAFQTRR